MLESMLLEIRTNIFLTGFMGAGKSTAGKSLAALLGSPFVDLDEQIVCYEKRSIADIFAAEGETYFRDCETKVLQDLCPQSVTIYATGGGIVVRDENRQVMKSKGRIIYLKTSWPTIKARLQQSVDRPLVDPAKGWDEVRNLWLKRQTYYEDADFVVDTDGLTPLQVAQKINLGLTP